MCSKGLLGTTHICQIIMYYVYRSKCFQSIHFINFTICEVHILLQTHLQTLQALPMPANKSIIDSQNLIFTKYYSDGPMAHAKIIEISNMLSSHLAVNTCD